MIKSVMTEHGVESTANMPVQVIEEVMDRLREENSKQ